MKTPTLADVLDAFETLYPAHLQEDWDASGLVIGRRDAEVKKILFAVDAIGAVAEEAVETGADLIITHHPLLLRGASFLPDTDYKGNIVHTLIENKCALLAAHTNTDSAVDGVNEALAQALGLTDVKVLTDEKTQTLNGAEHTVGIGRVGTLPQTTTLKELADALAQILPATAGGLRVAGSAEAPIQRVALCGGAGDSLFGAVESSDADVYITADLRHHPASELREKSRLAHQKTINLIDCSHFASEWVWLATGARRLTEELTARGFAIETQVSTLNSDPWDFRISTGEVEGSASTL
ncbi:Nif3-like dinuclear metal center hexameric protein [Rothia sp. ZJ932]|uniref:Nif3-like dinuclear metal center hexameric protein n=1 Tax=Rothia sp. ZJ932 TaxID=2810516 RepID=UPI0019675993|nr:Nif3-like dinuclear metal center hexameric protein [Rothia sp. ZJ932]QRZ62373.1 Nif3-like dinuclear metal center hexameric protein [Rothia sp. ZJ932]